LAAGRVPGDSPWGSQVKFATLRDGSRDGHLVIVSADLSRAVSARPLAKTMQDALDRWGKIEKQLHLRSDALNSGKLEGSFQFAAKACAAPLPRAYHWCDGSAFLNHGRLMQQAFGTDPIPDFETVPLLYQGGSDDFLGPLDDAPFPREEDGIDFEGEYGIITDDVPMGINAAEASSFVRLVVQLNDWSLRMHALRELKTGFGFYQAKPATSFAPVAVTPDELGSAWREGRVHLPLNVEWNGAHFGSPNGSEMQFSFFDLMAHAARTRRLGTGTIVGSGTISNQSRAVGSACIAERRVIELIDEGSIKTSFMKFGDTVRMRAAESGRASPFGQIEQQVVRATKARQSPP
jgi:fumarylacetoacetate (FAA) hydrolase